LERSAAGWDGCPGLPGFRLAWRAQLGDSALRLNLAAGREHPVARVGRARKHPRHDPRFAVMGRRARRCRCARRSKPCTAGARKSRSGGRARMGRAAGDACAGVARCNMGRSGGARARVTCHNNMGRSPEPRDPGRTASSCRAGMGSSGRAGTRAGTRRSLMGCARYPCRTRGAGGGTFMGCAGGTRAACGAACARCPGVGRTRTGSPRCAGGPCLERARRCRSAAASGSGCAGGAGVGRARRCARTRRVGSPGTGRACMVSAGPGTCRPCMVSAGCPAAGS
jgi:hypothetical protein